MGQRLNAMATDVTNVPGAPVQLHLHPAKSGHLVGEARLNSEQTLNALSLEMIDLMRPALEAWAGDERVVAVVLSGAGARAFSAGGDIQALYRAMVMNHEMGERVDEYPYEFFEREYRLDHLLHTYPKPLIALGHGVIMGGGLGIFSAAAFRLVPEKSRIALPEVTIGLFPDAGGTWLLRNLPEHVAVFLGLTGASINSADALASGVATHGIAGSEYLEVIPALTDLAWRGDPARDAELIGERLAAFAAAELPSPELHAVPESLHGSGTMQEVAERVRALEGASEWCDKGIAAMERGCPTTVGIVVEQLARSRRLTLAQSFCMEMTVATHCADNHDFAEGVRALLIDKDNAPNWQFGDIESVPQAYVQSHFAEPWARNPLADLEER
jgi:enoyl-CoA hydratase/carnithine racemase